MKIHIEKNQTRIILLLIHKESKVIHQRKSITTITLNILIQQTEYYSGECHK